MTLNTKTVLKAAALYTAMGILLGGVWTFGDKTGFRPWLKFEQNDFTTRDFQKVMDQTQQNTRALAQFKFDELWGLRKFGELTWEQKMSLCSLAVTLNYTVVDDQNRQICSDDGTPILSFQSNK